MLSKLVEHIRRNWGVYSWALGLANFALLAVLAYIVLSEAQKEGGLPWLLLSLLGLIVFLDLWLGLMLAPRTFAKFFSMVQHITLTCLGEGIGEL